MRSLGGAAITILTIGHGIGAAIPIASLADDSRPALERESAAWRTARMALFGGDEASLSSETSEPEIGAPAVPEEDPSGCGLQALGADLASSERCIECHAKAGVPYSSHPVNLGYTDAQAQSAGRLRPLEQVLARGVFLPDGMVQCTTCHDARSRWADHVALPPGAVALTAVDARKPHTYEGRPNWRVMTDVHSPPLPDGTAVSPAPLCAACHRLAD